MIINKYRKENTFGKRMDDYAFCQKRLMYDTWFIYNFPQKSKKFEGYINLNCKTIKKIYIYDSKTNPVYGSTQYCFEIILSSIKTTLTIKNLR